MPPTHTPETDLRLFFHPRTIAVIGATDDKRKPGYALLMKVKARAERDGARVYGVNPRLNDIDGIACFPTLADVPGEIDVAVIMIGDAEQGLRDVVAKAGRFAIIFTAGFREVGVYRRHARLDGEWRDCVIVEKLLGEARDHAENDAI